MNSKEEQVMKLDKVNSGSDCHAICCRFEFCPMCNGEPTENDKHGSPHFDNLGTAVMILASL